MGLNLIYWSAVLNLSMNKDKQTNVSVISLFVFPSDMKISSHFLSLIVSSFSNPSHPQKSTQSTNFGAYHSSPFHFWRSVCSWVSVYVSISLCMSVSSVCLWHQSLFLSLCFYFFIFFGFLLFLTFSLFILIFLFLSIFLFFFVLFPFFYFFVLVTPLFNYGQDRVYSIKQNKL